MVHGQVGKVYVLRRTGGKEGRSRRTHLCGTFYTNAGTNLRFAVVLHSRAWHLSDWPIALKSSRYSEMRNPLRPMHLVLYPFPISLIDFGTFPFSFQL